MEASSGEVQTLLLAQAGALSAFSELVRAHQASVYSLALRLLEVREDAQEVAQDVFLQLHRNLADISSASHLRFWLRRVVCHRSIDRLRRRPPAPDLPLDTVQALEAPDMLADPLLERELQRLVGQLPAMARAVVLLRYQEDWDPPQIARALDLPLNTVKSHLRRSLATLRAQLARTAEPLQEVRL